VIHVLYLEIITSTAGVVAAGVDARVPTQEAIQAREEREERWVCSAVVSASVCCK
jgi:hypothetical protein